MVFETIAYTVPPSGHIAITCDFILPICLASPFYRLRGWGLPLELAQALRKVRSKL